jgi:predicted nucleic acid-binding protein
VICYFDASAFVKLVIPEGGSAAASDLWSQADRVASSYVLYPEARSALARATRSGRLTRARERRARRLLEAFWLDLHGITPTLQITARAGALAEAQTLRALDAVHLASAEEIADRDLVLVAGDRALCTAARRVGLTVAQV